MQFTSQNVCIVKESQIKIEKHPNQDDNFVNNMIISNNNSFVCCISLFENNKEYYHATVRNLITNQIIIEHEDDADAFYIQFTPDSKYIFFLGEQDYIIYDLLNKQSIKTKFITCEIYKHLKLSFTEDSLFKLIQTNDKIQISRILGEESQIFQVSPDTFDWRFVCSKPFISALQILRLQKLLCLKIFRKKGKKFDVIKSFLLSFEPKYFQKIKAKIWNINNLTVIQHHFGLRVYNLQKNKLIRNLKYQTKEKPICVYQHLEQNQGFIVYSYDIFINNMLSIEFLQFLPTIQYQKPNPFQKSQLYLGQNSVLIQESLESDLWKQITFGPDQ
ncbi:unnamed protein product [Paramecium sonneborni]|uniref:Uncharacterized protein n=1 Tax=Paramecium sonneborni TaxID=65129 RepID=A0A8S1MVC5_9CILI|nr:unnamed protein product [Paramecium sonneborni]